MKSFVLLFEMNGDLFLSDIIWIDPLEGGGFKPVHMDGKIFHYTSPRYCGLNVQLRSVPSHTFIERPNSVNFMEDIES